jgi:AcrR family transcriptional regulator
VTQSVQGTAPPSRRDRLRAATRDEILQTARRLLVRDGPESVSLRAIAREMGMTAPGLYRYFGSHEELLRHVVAGIFTELAADLDHAIKAAGERFPRCDTEDDKDDEAGAHKDLQHVTAEMIAACSEFRRWALNHTAEFALVFGVPLPDAHDESKLDIAEECALRFAGVYLGLFLRLWEAYPFPVPDPEDIDQGLREQLTRYQADIGADVPTGAMLIFLRCWVLLYGAVAMEVFGHLGFAFDDPSAMFEFTLTDIAALVGLCYPMPPAGA